MSLTCENAPYQQCRINQTPSLRFPLLRRGNRASFRFPSRSGGGTAPIRVHRLSSTTSYSRPIVQTLPLSPDKGTLLRFKNAACALILPSPPAPFPQRGRGEPSACTARVVPPLPRRGRGGKGVRAGKMLPCALPLNLTVVPLSGGTAPCLVPLAQRGEPQGEGVAQSGIGTI